MLKQLSPSGSVKSGGYTVYLNASHLGIYPPLFISPSGDSCTLFTEVEVNIGGYLPRYEAAR